jgi:hypothetical protein
MSTISPTNQPEYFRRYIELVKEGQLQDAFIHQSEEIKKLLSSISEQKSMFSYAKDKWTLKELLQHLIDTERVFTYRAMCFARNEKAVLPSFYENEYAKMSSANRRTWESLCAEFVAVRKSTLFLYDSFSEDMLELFGQAANNKISVKELGFLTVGHFSHHQSIIEQRYL